MVHAPFAAADIAGTPGPTGTLASCTFLAHGKFVMSTHDRLANTDAQTLSPDGAKRATEEQRAIQRPVDKSDERAGKEKKEPRAMQAGARLYPAPPFPRQHLEKPGL